MGWKKKNNRSSNDKASGPNQASNPNQETISILYDAQNGDKASVSNEESNPMLRNVEQPKEKSDLKDEDPKGVYFKKDKKCGEKY